MTKFIPGPSYEDFMAIISRYNSHYEVHCKLLRRATAKLNGRRRTIQRLTQKPTAVRDATADSFVRQIMAQATLAWSPFEPDEIVALDYPSP